MQRVMGLYILLWTYHGSFRRYHEDDGLRWPEVPSAFLGLHCPASASSSGPCLGAGSGLDSWGRDTGEGFMARRLSKGRAAVGLVRLVGSSVSGGDWVEAPASRPAAAWSRPHTPPPPGGCFVKQKCR